MCSSDLLAPGQTWTFDTTLSDPTWAIFTVSSTTHGGRPAPMATCEISVDGQSDGPPGCLADLANTLTHEVGHLLGLAHINDAASTMNPRAVTGELTKRLLDPGSKKFVCDVYPKGQASKTCFIPKLGIESAKLAKTGCSEVPGLTMLALGAWLGRRRKR
mgnify:CR=1 FL=1